MMQPTQPVKRSPADGTSLSCGKLPTKFYIQTPQGPMLLQAVSAQNGIGVPYGSSVVTNVTGCLRKDGSFMVPSRKLVSHHNPDNERFTKSKAPPRRSAQDRGLAMRNSCAQPALTQNYNGFVPRNNNGHVKNVRNTKREMYNQMEIKLVKPVYVDVKLDRNRNYRRLDNNKVILRR